MRAQLLRGLICLPLLLAGGPALAHAPIPGIEGFYIGMLHPFSTPAQGVLMLGLGLLAGGFTVDSLRWLLGAFLAASLLGVTFGTAALELDPALYLVAVVACSLAALIPGRLLPLAVGVAAVGGLLIGFVSIPDDGPTRDRVITMAGSMVGANVGLLYLCGVSLFVGERLTWPWVSIAFRVVAAWTGAIALVMLALGFAAVETGV